MARQQTRPKEIEFVEDRLGLLTHLQQIEWRQSQVEVFLGRRGVQTQVIRDAEFAIEDRERNLTNNVVAESEGLPSVAALDRAIKLAINTDDDLSKMRQDLVLKQNELDQIQADLREHELGHRASIASAAACTEYMAFLRSARDARTMHARTVHEDMLPY